jgi:hypothetical protein
MKKSTLMHYASVACAIVGVLALVAAWVAGQGTVFGFYAIQLYINAIIFVLISVSAGVCAIYRRDLERA